MILTSAILILSGTLCLLLGGFIMYKLVPREGKPAGSQWAMSDIQATGVAMLVLILLAAGLILVGKGITN